MQCISAMQFSVCSAVPCIHAVQCVGLNQLALGGWWNACPVPAETGYVGAAAVSDLHSLLPYFPQPHHINSALVHQVRLVQVLEYPI